MVDIKIMAHPKRAENVFALCEKLRLSEEDIVWEDRPEGGDAMYTAKKTWLLPFQDRITHRAVIQDDVIVCDELPEILERISNTHPNYAFGGITMDWPFEVVKQKVTPYYKIPVLWGPIIMLPKKTLDLVWPGVIEMKI